MAATEEEKIPILGTFVTAVPGGQVVDTDNIRDPNMDDMTQSEINALSVSKKSYVAYDSYASFPTVGKECTLYFSKDNGFIWEYKVGTGYSLLSDNWRSLVAIHGTIN